MEGIEATPPNLIPEQDLASWLSIRESLEIVIRKQYKFPPNTKIVDPIAEHIKARLSVLDSLEK